MICGVTRSNACDKTNPNTKHTTTRSSTKKHKQVRLHASLGHEHVVALHAAFREGDHVVLVQEYAEGGDLFALLQAYGGRLSERVAVQMVLEPFLRVLQVGLWYMGGVVCCVSCARRVMTIQCFL